MISEDAVINMDKNLDRVRAAGDIKRFFAKKRLNIYLTTEGVEVAKEYIKSFETQIEMETTNEYILSRS
tara:strand:+ start:93 stop:299 length:207 start_codon:yes stop_codon:yes gene_type:complete